MKRGLSNTASALCLALASCVIDEESAASPPAGDKAGMTQEPTMRHRSHLAVDDRIGDLLNHPAFAGFAPRILPWDDRVYDKSLRLWEIGSLLPYHSHVEPAVVMNALNRMIDDANNGETIFYDFYTGVEKNEEPAKGNTGLFFFRGKPRAPFAIVCPGGGFAYIGSVHEGFPYAAAINARGYNVFVLRYRAGHGAAVATRDLAAALSWIFRNADRLGVGTGGYSLWGSSAGARMAAAIGSHGARSHGGDDLPRPAAVVMAYTAYSGHSAKEPPTFVVVGGQDHIAPPSAMQRRVGALRGTGVEVEYREYGGLGHGFGTGFGTSADGWIDDAVGFWERFLDSGNGWGQSP
ncbi:Acetyl esterase/lipase [Azospirillum oryzae]|uniref:Acetyl esterase/lipase n=1 Tax=Azospirillum oryzae TaxID=286727 RepID=A0A1X7HPP7_9PROT|nr:alpha/beta hydrolase [Azospirillum oryzae]SMF89973.1 Acetyl esterase/lipase [Azospirillum oryzae]